MLKGALAVILILALFDFAKGVSSGSVDPTKWLVWGGSARWTRVMVRGS